jgi:hypothetical protein
MRNYDGIRRAKWGYGGDAGSAGTLLCGEHSRNEDVEEGAPSASLPERLAAADPAKLRFLHCYYDFDSSCRDTYPSYKLSFNYSQIWDLVQLRVCGEASKYRRPERTK